MTVLYPNLCYNKVCYKKTALYFLNAKNIFVFFLNFILMEFLIINSK